ncbi:MAG TPA: hypothetical protein VNW95_10720 [Mucilaginibacter sp.]|jgi:hypothetical protein|nr:hypothetical protein [Mucilaginibacter sp.]
MKKTLLITLLLIPFLGMSQTTKPIEGFLGIKFGTGMAAVNAAVIAKGGVIDKAKSTKESVIFRNVKLGHREAASFIVKFVNDKAYEADFLFLPGQDARSIEYYNELVKDINDNYGKGDSQVTFKSPYSDKDSEMNKIVAIRSAMAEYKTYWESNDNSILAEITEDLTVDLIYQNDKLFSEAEAKQKAKEKSDY